MPIYDKRMFELIDHVISNNIKGIKGNPDFIKKVGIPTLATLDQVRNLKQSFRLQHFLKAATLFEVSMDWFFGFTNKMKRTDKAQSVEDLLQQALSQVKKKNIKTVIKP